MGVGITTQRPRLRPLEMTDAPRTRCLSLGEDRQHIDTALSRVDRADWQARHRFAEAVAR